MIWNMYDFFTMYAEVDDWEWTGEHEDPSESCVNPLDTWIVSRVHELTEEVEKHMEVYDIPNAVKPIIPFIEDASNWYVRRSRRRFWKSEDDNDKQQAYKTLHYVLVQLSKVMAPFTPFLAEELYRKLTGGESVHLLDWPKVGHINELEIMRMNFVREIVNDGLSQRARARLKVRQPLASVNVFDENDLLDESSKEVISEELNVKEVIVRSSLAFETTQNYVDLVGLKSSESVTLIDIELSEPLLREGLMREVVRNVQSARKQAGLQIDDRIKLMLASEGDELSKAIEEHIETIMSETLAVGLENSSQGYSYSNEVEVEGNKLFIELEKA